MFSILRGYPFWYNSRVKMILVTVAMMCICGSVLRADTVVVHSNVPPDTEFETNFVAEAWSAFDRILDVHLEFTASPSNNVQFAFGVDDDEDGVLSLAESECTVGWDCGSWFVSGCGSKIVESAVSPVGRKSFSWKVRLDSSDRLCELTATDGSTPVFANLSTNIPAWVCSKSWDTVRLTARGVVDPNGGLDPAIKPNPLLFIVR